MFSSKTNDIRINKRLELTPRRQIPSAVEDEIALLESEIQEMKRGLGEPRFKDITRLYSAGQVVHQRGTIENDYPIARKASEEFYNRLRDLFAKREQITTFGPYSPGQAVMLKRAGIEGIYLGGWGTSAKGSITADPGPGSSRMRTPDMAVILMSETSSAGLSRPGWPDTTLRIRNRAPRNAGIRA